MAVLSASAALLGALIGAAAAGMIAWWGYERETDATNRDSREDVYVAFMQEARYFEFEFRYGDVLRQEEGKTFVELIRAQQLVDLYGSGDVRSGARAVGTALLDAVGDEGEEAWKPFDESMAELRAAMRDDLEID